MSNTIIKCLFPAAGYGTRFLPATKSIPKEMLAVVNKPLIHYGVEEALLAGVTEMCVITGRNKEAISNYFDVQYELEDVIKNTSKDHLLDSVRDIMNQAVFTYVRQKKMRGLGDAILTGKPLIDDHPFAVVLADDLCFHQQGANVLSQMCALYEQHKCTIVAVERVEPSDLHNYGVVMGEVIDDRLTRVTSMIEKPEPGSVDSDLAIIGRYILTPDIFDILQQAQPGVKGEIQITDAINQQASAGHVLAYRFEGQRFDCGQIAGMIQAVNYVYDNKLNLSSAPASE